jgi:ribonuclease E
VLVARDDALIPPAFRLERLRAYGPADATVLPTPPLTQAPHIEDEGVEDEIERGAEAAESDRAEQEGEEERGRSRRRRRRRRHRDEEPVSASAARSEVVEQAAEAGQLIPVDGRAGGEDGNGEEENEAEGRRRRRGRRGGRRRGRRESDFEPIFEEPRPPSDLVQILPASDMEELEPAAMAGLASTAGEIGSAQFEAARESGLPVPDPVSAPGAMPGEIADLAAPPDHLVEARAAAEAAGFAERELSSTGETERTPEAAFSAGAPPAEPEHPVRTGSEKSSTPRRGWWQRLIQP